MDRWPYRSTAGFRGGELGLFSKHHLDTRRKGSQSKPRLWAGSESHNAGGEEERDGDCEASNIGEASVAQQSSSPPFSPVPR